MATAPTSGEGGRSISDWRRESDDSIAVDISPTLATARCVASFKLRDELHLLHEQIRQPGSPPELLDRRVHPVGGGARRLRVLRGAEPR